MQEPAAARPAKRSMVRTPPRRTPPAPPQNLTLAEYVSLCKSELLPRKRARGCSSRYVRFRRQPSLVQPPATPRRRPAVSPRELDLFKEDGAADEGLTPHVPPATCSAGTRVATPFFMAPLLAAHAAQTGAGAFCAPADALRRSSEARRPLTLRLLAGSLREETAWRVAGYLGGMAEQPWESFAHALHYLGRWADGRLSAAVAGDGSGDPVQALLATRKARHSVQTAFFASLCLACKWLDDNCNSNGEMAQVFRCSVAALNRAEADVLRALGFGLCPDEGDDLALAMLRRELRAAWGVRRR